jgi:hypothetical protein
MHTLLVAALMMMLAGMVLLTVYGNNSVRGMLRGPKSSRVDCLHHGAGIFRAIGTMGRTRRSDVLPVSVDAHTPLLVLDYCTSTGGACSGKRVSCDGQAVQISSQGWASSRVSEVGNQRSSYARNLGRHL